MITSGTYNEYGEAPYFARDAAGAAHPSDVLAKSTERGAVDDLVFFLRALRVVLCAEEELLDRGLHLGPRIKPAERIRERRRAREPVRWPTPSMNVSGNSNSVPSAAVSPASPTEDCPQAKQQTRLKKQRMFTCARRR